MRIIRIITWALFTIALVSCSTTLSDGNTQEIIEGNQTIAREIIDAIDQYKDTNGTFPQTLDELAPMFIDVVPKTRQDKPFTYEIHEHEGYSLSFKITRQSDCSYLHHSDFWDCGFFDNH